MIILFKYFLVKKWRIPCVFVCLSFSSASSDVDVEEMGILLLSLTCILSPPLPLFISKPAFLLLLLKGSLSWMEAFFVACLFFWGGGK